MAKPKKSPKKLIIKISAAILALPILFYIGFVRPDPFFNPNNVPKIVTANYVNISQIYEVSKFRSGAGHDYSSDGESCRSMKHYINTSHNSDPVTHIPLRSQPTADQPNIDLYAPFDGLIYAVGSEHTPIGKQVSIMALKNPFFDARLFHIDLLPGLHAGSFVKSGQKIATIGPKDGTDIAIEASSGGPGGHNVSYFDAMTDQAFKPFADLGYKRSDFVETKAYRDANPLQCQSSGEQRFTYPPGYDMTSDFVFLKPDPNGDLFGGSQGQNGPSSQQGPGQAQMSPQIHYGPPAR